MSLAASDQRIATPLGHLFARAWTPVGASDAAIVLLHDSLGCVALWRDFPAKLAAATGRTVVAYDRLGFGQSDPHPGSIAHDFIPAEAQNITLLCAALGLDRIIPFGHSVGGGMSVNFAAQQPERCAAVITVAAQAFVEDRTLDGIRAAKSAFRDPTELARLTRYHGDKARWVLEAWTETWLSPRMADWTLDAALAQVRCPLLAIHGDRDEFGSLVHPERIAAGARGQQLVLSNCGHVPHREQTQTVLDAVAGFLDGR